MVGTAAVAVRGASNGRVWRGTSEIVHREDGIEHHFVGTIVEGASPKCVSGRIMENIHGTYKKFWALSQ